MIFFSPVHSSRPVSFRNQAFAASLASSGCTLPLQCGTSTSKTSASCFLRSDVAEVGQRPSQERRRCRLKNKKAAGAQLEGDRAATAICELVVLLVADEGDSYNCYLGTRVLGGRLNLKMGYNCNLGTRGFLWWLGWPSSTAM